ncbi:MAG: TIGR03118 family protein [Acidimicrobiales bacterium]
MNQPNVSRKSAPRMRRSRWFMAAIPIAAIAGAAAVLSSAGAAGAQSADDFTQTNLVANTSTQGAQLVDPNLQNAWGLTASPSGPIWVSDNNSGKATVYTGGVNGSAVNLELTVRVPGGNATGQVFNSTADFPVGGTSGSAADFIVSSDSVGATQSPGRIEAWNGGAKFIVEDGPTGGAGGTTPANAVFKGIAISPKSKSGPLLYAADVANATIDIFNDDFEPVSMPGTFTDPSLPAGYAPFNIAYLGGKLYVTYGKQNAKKTDVVPGNGFGVVDVYNVNGKLLQHLISNGPTSPLDEPWGVAIAPSSFGPFSGDLLVGNLGNGWINAFDPSTGAFVGTLDGSKGHPITIDGLWGLEVGNAAFGGSSSIVFSAGPEGYADGLLGILDPAS